MKRASTEPSAQVSHRLSQVAVISASSTEVPKHPLVVHLPIGLALLRSHREPIDQLQLNLVAAKDTDADAWDELQSAVVEALAYCPQLRSLAIRCDGDASPAFLDHLCGLLAECDMPLQSLKLSFTGPETTSCLAGMCALMRRPGLQLDCQDSLAARAAIIARSSLAAKAVLLEELDISGTLSRSEHLINCLCRLQQADNSTGKSPDPRIDLCVADDDDPQRFIDALLVAGVSPTLRLTVRRSDAEPIDLPEYVDALRRTQLDPELARLHPNGHLNRPELLKHCQGIGAGGAQLFAWACSTATTTDPDEMPEVPIGMSGYLRALRRLSVPLTLSCTLPADAQALSDHDKMLIESLRIDFGDTSHTDAVLLPVVAEAFKDMTRLRTCTVHHQAASPAFSDWLLDQLMDPPLDNLRLDLGDAEAPGPSESASRVLRSSLVQVICVGAFSAALFLQTAGALRRRHTKGRAGPVLCLDLSPAAEPKLLNWLEGVKWTLFKLHVHFVANPPAATTLATFNEALKKEKEAPTFTVAWICTASRPHTTGFTALTLETAKRDILGLMQEAEKAEEVGETASPPHAGKSEEHDPFEPQELDRPSTTRAVLAAIGTEFSDSSGLDDGQRQRIRSAVPQMTNVFDYMTESRLLLPNDWRTLSSLRRSTRKHFMDLSSRQEPAAVRWVQEQRRRGFYEAYYRPILLGLFGTALTDRILKAVEQAPPVVSV